MGQRKDCIFKFNDMSRGVKDINPFSPFFIDYQCPEVCQGIFFVGFIRTNDKISRLLAQENYSVWNKSRLDGWLQV